MPTKEWFDWDDEYDEPPLAVNEGAAVWVEKLTQEKAGFAPLGGSDTQACANCQWFMAPSSCHVVEDWPNPIVPTGLSTLWRERVKYEPEPMEVRIVKSQKATAAAANWMAGFKAFVQMVRGKEPEREGFASPSESGMKFTKDSTGALRWFAWVSNNGRDADNPPELFESKAHQEFAAHCEQTGEYPEAWLFHQEGTKWGQADWVDYADGFLVASGTVDPGFEHIAQNLASMPNLGVSHGYKYRYSSEPEGVIGWYRSYEISALPLEAAANKWTGIDILKGGTDMFGRREFLVKALGEDAVKALEGATADASRKMDASGVQRKSTTEPDGTEEPKQPEAAAIAETPAESAPAAAVTPENEEAEKAAFKALIGEAMGEAVGPKFKSLEESLAGIEARVKALEKSDDEKIAAVLSGARSRGSAYRASASDDNTGDKGETSGTEGSPHMLDGFVASLMGKS